MHWCKWINKRLETKFQIILVKNKTIEEVISIIYNVYYIKTLNWSKFIKKPLIIFYWNSGILNKFLWNKSIKK